MIVKPYNSLPKDLLDTDAFPFFLSSSTSLHLQHVDRKQPQTHWLNHPEVMYLHLPCFLSSFTPRAKPEKSWRTSWWPASTLNSRVNQSMRTRGWSAAGPELHGCLTLELDWTFGIQWLRAVRIQFHGFPRSVIPRNYLGYIWAYFNAKAMWELATGASTRICVKKKSFKSLLSTSASSTRCLLLFMWRIKTVKTWIAYKDHI